MEHLLTSKCAIFHDVFKAYKKSFFSFKNKIEILHLKIENIAMVMTNKTTGIVLSFHMIITVFEL